MKLSDAVGVSDTARLSVARRTAMTAVRRHRVNSKLNNVLSLKFSNTIRYVHAPAATFQTTDTITAVALVAKF
jgi:hypothetical protein